MQSIDRSIWCAKEAPLRAGVLPANILRKPATLPDEVLRAEFERFLDG